MTKQVHILLATFNGAQYLGEQLESIAWQRHTNWMLWVADDGSSDATLDILATFAREYPDKVLLMQFESPVRSAKKNFLRMLHNLPPHAEYIAFCDQDDVWDPEKLRELVRECETMECGEETGPVLVHSDLILVNDRNTVTANSFMKSIQADPLLLTFAQLLVENSIPGCSMLFNGHLAGIIRSHSGPQEDIIMHDWWVAILAAGCGKIAYVPQPLIRYRQHSFNTAGAVKRSGISFVVKKAKKANGSSIRATWAQAKLINTAHGESLSAANREIVQRYGDFYNLDKLQRVAACVKYGILKQTIARKIYQLLTV